MVRTIPPMSDKDFPVSIDFPEVSDNDIAWKAQRQQVGSELPRYDISRSDGTYVGFIASNGRLWTNKRGSAIQIDDSGRNFDVRSRKSILQAVRLTYLITQTPKQ